MMTLEEFKNLSAGIQSLLVGLAVLIGGLWALYRFLSLKEVKKATAELERLKRDLQQRGKLAIEMKTTQMFSRECPEKYIQVSLTMKNVGNRTEVLRWRDSRVGAALVERGEQGEVQLGPEAYGAAFALGGDVRIASIIDPGVTASFSFLIPVETAGVYFLYASILGTPRETEEAFQGAASAGIVREDTQKAHWSAEMFFSVVECADEPPNKTMQPTAVGG